MTVARYPLDEFIHDLTDLVAAEPDQATLFARGSRLTERLVRDPQAVPEPCRRAALDNPSDRPTVEIHVYGRDLVGLPRCRYDPATGTVSTYVLGTYDNC